MKERIKGRKNYPTEEVDPENFLDDKAISNLINNLKTIKFHQEDYYKLYNCVHCGECKTEKDRIILKQKFLENGNILEGLEEMKNCFKNYRTPYPTKKMRIKRPSNISKDSDTLFFMGCLSTIRIPKYTEHAINYLLDTRVDFTLLDEEICCGWPWFASGSMDEFLIAREENVEIFNKFKKVICLCPACYYLFNQLYKPLIKRDVKFDYISTYLKPSKTKKSGNVGVQHLCQLMNRGSKGIEKEVDNILRKAGYDVKDIPHWCCGGGIGQMHRKEVIDKIARLRMEDFNREDLDIITTYCPGCWWILDRYSKKCKIKPKAVDIFQLLTS